MKVLLVGGGGREHALGWKIAQSPRLKTLYLAPGNPGLNDLGQVISIGSDDNKAITAFSVENGVDLVVVGPEAPLAAGLADDLEAVGVPCFGPSAAAARLESSKAFTKEICAAVDAPTAAYGRFTEPAAAKRFLESQSAPFVIKADGLAAGKGVVIAGDAQEAHDAIDRFLENVGDEIVIEEFMHGEEASFFVLTDGRNIVPMIGSQDHKRALDGDKGPNTGGMGVYAPAPVFTDDVQQQTIDEIILPVLQEMERRGTPYRGVLYAGLMIDENGPRLIEFNARFGDPECQVMMRLLESDILPALAATAAGDVKDIDLSWRDEACALIVMAANGYPGSYEKGSEIRGVDAADEEPGVVVFQAGTRKDDDRLLAHGGRVLNITATGANIRQAVDRAYNGIERIDWTGGFFRRDIGWRALTDNAREADA